MWFWRVWFWKSWNCELDVFYVLVSTVRSGVASDFMLLILCCVLGLMGYYPLVENECSCVVMFYPNIFHFINPLCLITRPEVFRGWFTWPTKRGKLAKILIVTSWEVWAGVEDKKKIEILTGWWWFASVHKWYYQIDPPGKGWTGAGQPAVDLYEV